MRRAATLLIACTAAVLAAAPAHAATATLTGTNLYVTALPGEANIVTITDGLTVVDNGVTLISGADASVIVVELGDRSDTLTVTAAVPVTVRGGAGNDRITGGAGDDVFDGGTGAEPRQNRPRAPFRWVGYNGDRNHGRGNHLHLSWRHTATKPGRIAATVWTLALR